MNVRDEADAFLLITQPDHAQLAEDIVAAMRTEPPLGGPARGTILLATREHDNGWIEVDAEPTIDPATGRPCDFIAGPARVKHELWPRGITRVARTHPRAGALIAEHAVTVYGYRRDEPEWIPFFASITAIRDALLDQIGMLDGARRGQFDADYRCLRLGDLFSLQFCNGWYEQHDALGYRVVMRDSTLFISPDPFEGAAIPLRVLGRRIPARAYRDDADLRSAVAEARPEVITGEARGGLALAEREHSGR
jgi:hypothetical protein